MSDVSEPLLIAVDGGGSGCRAAVGTLAAGVIGQATGGPANVETDFGQAIANIQTTVDTALARAGHTATPVSDAIALIGVAGGNGGPLVTRTSDALPYGSVTVEGDRATTVAGALGGRDGYVIAPGTGTIIARQQRGRMTSVGGWGFTVSDQASGAWLGKRLLAQTVLAEDGLAPHSPLTRKTLSDFGGNLEIFLFSGEARPHDFAALAPRVAEAASAGDPVARTLMAEGADYLFRGLTALGFTEGDPLVLSGGLGPSYTNYLPQAATHNLIPAQGTALDGAFRMAKQVAASRRP